MFESGLCCSESALLALARAQGLDSPAVPAIASAFCGGLARTGGPCGALTGALMGMSIAIGRTSADQSVKASYATTRLLVNEFEQVFGSKDCHQLLGFEPNDPDSATAAYEREGRRERCALITGQAAEMAARIINDQR